MKKLLILYLIMNSFELSAQDPMKKITVNMLPGSTLSIIGRTNVNRFTCKYDAQLLQESHTIVYRESSAAILLKNFDLTLKVMGFDCGSKGINQDFFQLLKAEDYAEITLSIEKIKPISEGNYNIFARISLAGANKNYRFPVALKKNELTGELEVNIRSFGLTPPKKALGLVKVKELIKIRFKLLLANDLLAYEKE